MTDFPGIAVPMQAETISSFDQGPNFPSPSSGTLPTANLALFFPFRVFNEYLVRQLWCRNGSAVSGTIDIGIYDRDGTLLVAAGSTAQAGTNAFQVIDTTDYLLYSGQYYIALSCSNTTSTFIRWNTSNLGLTRGMGVVQMAAAHPLPATATFATQVAGNIILCGLTSRTDF